MRLTLGDYQTSMSTTVLTRKRPDSGAANPEIIVAKSRRFIYMGEPDENEPINTSVMKQFSGEDVVEARALYGEQEKFRIMGKIFMMCNKLPPVTSMDEGTWRRIRVIPFESSFLAADNPELLLNKPNTFPRDPQMDEKLRSWRVHFLSLLVHIYQTQYIVNGLSPVPDVVMKESNGYKQRFDVFASFEADRIRVPKTIDEQIEFRSNPIDTNRIIAIFNAWKKEYKFGGLTGRDVITRLETKFGSPERGRLWSSFVVFDSDDRAIEWDKAHTTAETT
jgi:phage/plasmid-associated DNA primase